MPKKADKNMKIGIFDSGLGGLIIAKSIKDNLPDYDYVYLGDTMHLPYGGRSYSTIYELTKTAVEFLFKKHNCKLVIIACNTASALALRRLQQDWLAKHYPDRRVLGVIVPTVETVDELNFNRVGVIATSGTVRSKMYKKEIAKINEDIQLFEKATPLIVPIVENNGEKWAKAIIKSYLKPVKKVGVNALLLGCTHYPYFKDMIQKIMGKKTKIISQDEIIPEKLKTYLNNHPEIETKLSKASSIEFFVNDKNPNYVSIGNKLYGFDIDIKKANF